MTDEQIDTTALREHAGKGRGDDCLLPKASVNRMADELDSLRALLAGKPAVLPFGTLKALWKNGSDNRDLLEGSMAHAFALRIFAAQNAATPTAPAQSCGEDSIYSFERCGIKPTPQPIPQFADAPSFDPLARMASGPELQERLRAAHPCGDAEQADEAATCPLACTTECKAELHGCASECQSLKTKRAIAARAKDNK